MPPTDPWLLPEGIEEILPEDAHYMEGLRRNLLDVFSRWGYERVIPPLIDFLSSLKIASGQCLDLQTFKLIDQLSGEMLGIRADMTPQVARIDAHQLNRAWPTRLCYAGTVVHAQGNSLDRSRTPIQIGAELFAYQGLEGDIEIIRLMLEMLAIAKLQNVHLDLGHVGVYRGLVAQAALNQRQEVQLFDVLQRKAQAELEILLESLPLNAALKAIFLQLASLNGGNDVFSRAHQVLNVANEPVQSALAELQQVSVLINKYFPALPVSYDLAELRGYHYHTGLVFAAFVPECGREIARGGRYDNIGMAFGRARPATGFSADLKVLSVLSKQLNPVTASDKIFAPASDDPQLIEMIQGLRSQGRIVIQQLAGQTGGAEEMDCTSVIAQQQQSWLVNPLSSI